MHIHLECAQGRLTEAPEPIFLIGNHQTFIDSILRLIEYGNMELLYDQWYTVFEDYVGRLLTHQSDTLPAISGLARIMAAEIDDTYLVGLWKNDLQRGLLWRATQPFEDWACHRRHLALHGQAGGYIAPTWSWACRGVGHGYEKSLFTAATEVDSPNIRSVHSRLDVTTERRWRSECHISAAWCTPVAAEHPYGQLNSAELHIFGKLKHFTSSFTLIWNPYSDDGSGVTCAFDFVTRNKLEEMDTPDVFMLLIGTSCHMFNRDWPTERHFKSRMIGRDDLVRDMTKAIEKEELLRFYQYDEYAPDYRNAWGLALTTVPGTDKFVRIGMFRIGWEFGGPEYFDGVPVSTVKII